MRYILFTLALLLTACPATPPRSSTGAGPGAGGAGAHGVGAQVRWPAAALAYLEQCLNQPEGEGNAPLGPVCELLAQFPQAKDDPAFAAVKTALLNRRGQMGESLPSEIAAAWLVFEPQPAREYLAGKLQAGDEAALKALRFDPVAGRELLRKCDPAKLNEAQAARVFELWRQWGGVEAADKPLLEHFTTRAPVFAYRAWGYLLRLEPDNAAYFANLDAAVRNAQPAELSAAAEGAKLSGHAKLADALVGYIAQVKLGAERIADTTPAAEAIANADAPKAPPQPHKPAQPASSMKVLLGAYALAYLPGEQAQFARKKLLGAEDPAVCWQARLGELLHGDAQPWQDALKRQGAGQQAMWLALEPPEAVDPALAGTYFLAAESQDALLRGRAALQLNRYPELESDKQAYAVLSKLCADKVPSVREVAWYTLGKLGLDPEGADPLTVVGDTSAPPAVRLAAAYCALKLAGQPAQ